MPRLAILLLLSFALCACKNDFGVGEPCMPESIPCDKDGKNCGFERNETYLQTEATQCEARACIVHRLDNDTDGHIPADPRLICEQDESEGCVPQANLDKSLHCTCRCDGAKGAANRCECPHGFVCQALSRDPSELGSYCVRPQ